jgi:hypothetical protein
VAAPRARPRRAVADRARHAVSAGDRRLRRNPHRDRKNPDSAETPPADRHVSRVARRAADLHHGRRRRARPCA